MCYSCWEDYEPQPVTPAIRVAACSIVELYKNHVAGGSLHVYVDDWNLPVPEELPDYLSAPWHRELDEIERDCWSKMAALSEDEQATALAITDKFHKPREVALEDVTTKMLHAYRAWASEPA